MNEKTVRDKHSDPAEILRELGVPCTQRGQPDLRNHVPKRFIPLEEAQARGWSMFWTGASCRYGHQAARKTSNINSCSDCEREKAGQPAIYPKSKAQEFYEKPRRPAKDSAPILAAAPIPQPEVDPADKRLLDAYALHRDLEKAAAAVGTTPALINARRSHQQPLDAAMVKLEADLSIPRYVPVSPEFEWTDDKRARLLESYIDSGNLAVARDSIKCSPSQLWKELDVNPRFSGQLDAAHVRAVKVLEETAVKLALAGNDRLLPVILKAERPDKYTEKQRVDIFSDISRLSEEQLNTRLFALLERADGIRLIDTATDAQILDGEIVEPAALLARDPAPEPTPNNQDLA